LQDEVEPKAIAIAVRKVLDTPAKFAALREHLRTSLEPPSSPPDHERRANGRPDGRLARRARAYALPSVALVIRRHPMSALAVVAASIFLLIARLYAAQRSDSAIPRRS